MHGHCLRCREAESCPREETLVERLTTWEKCDYHFAFNNEVIASHKIMRYLHSAVPGDQAWLRCPAFLSV